MRGLAGKYHKGGFQGVENILCILTEVLLVHEFSLLSKLTALEDNDDCLGHHLPAFTSPSNTEQQTLQPQHNLKTKNIQTSKQE